MFNIFRTKSFKQDYKKLSLDDKELLKEVIVILTKGEKLDEKYQDHKLLGDYLGCRECHVKPDLLLIYRINNSILELALTRVGSHPKLFK